MVLDWRAGNLDKTLVAVMRNCGAYPEKGHAFKMTMHLFDLDCIGRSAEAENPPAGDVLAFFAWIDVEILDFMDASCNYPTDKPEEGGSAGSVKCASCTWTCVLL